MPRTHDEQRPWIVFAIVLSARAYRSVVLTLVALALLPPVIGWHSYLVSSGSMEPAIGVGDVAIARPLSPDDAIDVGRVYAFTDRSTLPSRTLVHRVVGTHEDEFITRGDANNAPDSTFLRSEDVLARGALLTPWVGLPVLWARSSQWGPLGLWAVLTVAAFLLAAQRMADDPPRLTHLVRQLLQRPPHDPPDDPPPSPGASAALVTACVSTIGLVTAIGVAGARLAPVEASFTARTSNAGNSWGAAQDFLHPYVRAVQQTGPTGFWLLDETGEHPARNLTNANNPGTFTGSRTQGQDGALSGKPGRAVTFSGGRLVLAPWSGSLLVSNAFSIEFWIRFPTVSPAAERFLAGYQVDTGSGPGLAAPRIILTSTNRVEVNGNGLGSVAATSGTLSPGQWHQVVVTAPIAVGVLARTLRLYVDGVQVATGGLILDLTALLTGGNWRLGQGHTTGSAAMSYNGSVDNISLYAKEITANDVKRHYCAAKEGAPPYTATTPTALCRPS